MPEVLLNDAKIYYEEQGTGPETILFAHGLLWSGRMFAEQVKVLSQQYRCITYDFRGQGKSQVTPSGYDIESLYEDTVVLIEKLNCLPCHFAGLSMGGFVGMRLAIRHPKMLKSLILMETSANPEPQENIHRYRMLNLVARWIGLGLVADRVMPIMFGRNFMEDPARATERAAWRQMLVSNHRIGITKAVVGVINRLGVADQLSRISTPTLIIVGDQDIATVPAESELMHTRIPNSKLVVIPGAGHTSTVEEAAAVTSAIQGFLAGSKG